MKTDQTHPTETVKTGYCATNPNDPKTRVVMGLSANQNAGISSDRKNLGSPRMQQAI
jgi:hypothetical protein